LANAVAADWIPPEDAQIVDFTRDLLRKHRVDKPSAEAMLARFGHDQFIQLTGAIGYYSMLAMTVNACELEPGEVLERDGYTLAVRVNGVAYTADIITFRRNAYNAAIEVAGVAGSFAPIEAIQLARIVDRRMRPAP